MRKTITMTEAQMNRLTHSWDAVARETLRIEQINGAIYAFGSELACLRLYYHYRYSATKARAAYSTNLSTWYFSLDVA